MNPRRLPDPPLLAAIRADILRMASHSAHVGVSLSCVDMIATLYFSVMDRPGSADGDRFILSKGHGAMALYAVLAHHGAFDRALLETYGRDGSTLAEHPLAGKVPGIEFATGSLGHGLAVASGMARGLKLAGSRAKVYALLGDGECDEGSVWEAAGISSTAGLDNLVALVDRNGLQACAPCAAVSAKVDLAAVWAGFGWEVLHADGHDPASIHAAATRERLPGRPRVVLCATVKGKGIPFMENDLEWHYRPVRGEALARALAHLGHA